MTRKSSLEERVADLENDEEPDVNPNWDLTPLSTEEKKMLAEAFDVEPNTSL